MTVCLAALCHDDHIVAVSDRMFTIGGIAEYETSLPKATILPTHHIMILMAGNPSFHGEVLEKVRAVIRPTETEINHLDVMEVAKLYKESANELHSEREQEPIFRKYALTPETFISRQSELSPVLIDRVLNDLDTVKSPPVSALILGYDQRQRPQILRFNEGALTLESASGFAAIGTGDWHAATHLHDSKFRKGALLGDGLLYCYSAKKRAELAPGVGPQTRIMYINKQGYHNLDPMSESALEELYKRKERGFLDVMLRISKEWHERFNEELDHSTKIKITVEE